MSSGDSSRPPWIGELKVAMTINRSNGGIVKKKVAGNRSVDDGICLCSKCGVRVSHQKGKPCNELRCPNCGLNMVRD